jgi:predicted transcriptional regulator
MARRPGLSKGELEVARVLWGLGEATVGQLHEAFPKRRKIDYTTVQTYLRRLDAKGYLRVRRRKGRTKIYSLRVRPSQVIRETVDDLLVRLFNGDTLPLLQHLINDRGLSDEEVRRLREMLDRWEAEQDESAER